ncbi:hypothetical protein [Polaribacter sp. Hel1_85]|uniref:hypothetical protein n=1 Tax=Polaribacter sp. Hel1_85 TaxID=1250005 RepID=UPI00052B6ECD|nr:hypothetical protein [Polaribacter sp. Hel1_85]KGL62283.1 hypothetical protein PHEL85_2075 [Polaribacter sp. Hel1_85]
MNKIKITKYFFIFLLSFGALSCGSDDPVIDEPVIVDPVDPVDPIDPIEDIIYTTVNTIAEFNTSLNQNDVNIKLAAGTYRFGPDDVTSGLIPHYEMFVFRGNNSNYDFTDVTFEFETELWSSYGSEEVVQLRLYGENITVKNLTVKDIGDSAPTFRARNMHLDGVNNTVDGFNFSTSGSYPYGYGDLFGKGGTYTIKHRKHSGILIRGEGNTLQNTNIQSRSYGHVVFIQGGKDVLIDNVYVEGDAMRTTDDILAEEGTGTPADNVNFLTVWGFKVPAGYMISSQEAGFRSYASAEHYSGNGTTSTTENVTIKNCTAKHVRSGFNLVFGGGTMIMENCTSIENESGFAIQKGGSIINCKSDAKYGSVYTNAYDSDSNITADITITNSDDSYGTHPIAYIGSGNQKITFNSDETSVSQERSIQLGGDQGDLRHLEGVNSGQNNQSATTSVIINRTKYSVELTELASGNVIHSCGTVTDNGSGNSISELSCD